MDHLLISKDSFSVLEYLYSGKKLPDPLPNEWDDCLKQLSENKLAVYRIVGHRNTSGETGFPFSMPLYEVSITESGKAYYESVLSNSEFSEKQLAILQGISDRLERRVTVAEEEAQRAKKDARTATIQSWIAIAVSVLALLLPIILN